MESILTIDLKNNQELLEDFDGISPGDMIKVSACYKVSELSENRLSAPLDEVYSITLKESESEDDEGDEEESEEKAPPRPNHLTRSTTAANDNSTLSNLNIRKRWTSERINRLSLLRVIPELGSLLGVKHGWWVDHVKSTKPYLARYVYF